MNNWTQTYEQRDRAQRDLQFSYIKHRASPPESWVFFPSKSNKKVLQQVLWPKFSQLSNLKGYNSTIKIARIFLYKLGRNEL